MFSLQTKITCLINIVFIIKTKNPATVCLHNQKTYVRKGGTLDSKDLFAIQRNPVYSLLA
jgi:hypothetical protein